MADLAWSPSDTAPRVPQQRGDDAAELAVPTTDFAVSPTDAGVSQTGFAVSRTDYEVSLWDRANATEPPTLAVRGLVKRYGAIMALDDVDLDVRRGEVVALVGENGAGKSTLVSILSGMIKPDGGTILLDDAPVRIDSPGRAQSLGIATVFQGLALCDNLDVVKNLFLGREIGSFNMDEPAMERQSRQLLKQIFSTVASVRDRVGELSGGQRQTVAIARTLLGDPSIVLLDEPTAALGTTQRMEVLNQIVQLRARGLGVIMISHNLDDVGAVADRVVVLRHGRNNGVFDVARTTTEQVHLAMTGALPARNLFDQEATGRHQSKR